LGCRLAAMFNKRSAEAQRTQKRGRGILVVGRFAGSLAWQCGAGGGDSRFELSTRGRRGFASPGESGRCNFNTAHLGCCCEVETGRGDWLRALQDRLHQPYRQALIPGYEEVRSAAAGAYGMVISGAGPTYVALVDAAHSAAAEVAMREAWNKEGITAQVRSLSIDLQGQDLRALQRESSG